MSNSSASITYDELKVYTKCTKIQWVATASLSVLITAGFIVYQVPYWFGANPSSQLKLGTFFVLTLILSAWLYEWFNSKSQTFWGRSFESTIQHGIRRNTYLDIETIKQRTNSLVSAMTLCVICFVVGILFKSSHYFLSFLVPVLSSVIASSAVDETVNNWRPKTLLMIVPCTFVFAVVLSLGSTISGIKVDDNLTTMKFVIEFGVWVSNGFLGVFVLYVFQRLISRWKI
ncbi:hypothetical protein [Vibrio splendidus]|uniref:hypothetical protein n=1 Tax=Vibrio splendidus TaxID=29497 RepID=UPI003D0F91C4